ncbi:hypothetical protein [Polaribacter sp.]|uniref:hypothetical protein n=1 Tax=Polaribacter sp. TaxID=1920175 RepID=UPI003F6B2B92
MKKLILLIVFATYFLPTKNHAQDKELIFNNLTYINQQFNLYNEFQTLWAIDYKSKEIICFDKFGSYHAKISDIIIEPKNNSAETLNFKCISGSCLKPSGSSAKKRDSYSMGLSKNLTTVTRKFQEILKQYGNTNSNSNVIDNSNKYNSGIKESVGEILNRITEIFQVENKYKHKWYANWSENYIYSKTESCEVRIPLGKNISIEKTERGYKFISSEKNLREKCTSFDNLVVNTYQNINSEEAKNEVIFLFKEILSITK